ncbi:hypothetical protein LCGC14_2972200 [marine sediment metagenome]|uniref:Uncharacterized protein n=1 Tax=marine sediment metagenome TaxID=412755 RepID=A0A0F8XWI9_9ZZZZ
MKETILAIDPGTTKSAYLLYQEGSILGFDKLDNCQILLVAEGCNANLMAIEMPACYGMAVGKSVFETCRWVGIFQQAFGLSKTYLVYRKSCSDEGVDSILMHLCHNTRAKDTNVRRAIIDLYGGDEKAIGGVRCRKCNGKGWFGAGRPVCPVCNGDKWKSPPGPLKGIVDDAWAALAVAITFDETFIRCRNT